MPIPPHFSKIKKGLNPLRSYVIFERPAGTGDEGSLMKAVASLGDLEIRILSTKTYRDEKEKMVMLVIELEPAGKDKALKAFLEFDLSDEISFYAYGPSSTQ